MTDIAEKTGQWSRQVNWFVERFCVLLLVLLVLDVWLGILARRLLPFPLSFTEELARYLMIWTALLAVSSGIAHREHIGVEFLFSRLPAQIRRGLALAFDLLALGFFLVLFLYGIGFTIRGFARVTMIYGMPKGVPFAGVPLAAALACIQIVLVGMRDFFNPEPPETTGATIVPVGEE
ncbi:MAG: TRAP transporter small permease [Pseudodonghicola sp.]|nr:TRAP transporter small permease [Pseudodonghicola sp.]